MPRKKRSKTTDEIIRETFGRLQKFKADNKERLDSDPELRKQVSTHSSNTLSQAIQPPNPC